MFEHILFLLVLGAINHQITHIITTGVILEDLRAYIQTRIGGKCGYLVTCHLCCGFWVGFGQALVITEIIELSPDYWINVCFLTFAISLVGRVWNECLALASSKVSEIRKREVPCGCP